MPGSDAERTLHVCEQKSLQPVPLAPSSHFFNAQLSTVRSREVGDGGWGVGALYLTLHCHHQDEFGIKMGSDESL